MRTLRTVFLGTPAFAVPTLERLAEDTEVVLVITQPDQPAGRGRKELAPPVKVRALALGLDVVQPESLRGAHFAEMVAERAPDFLVTAAFGKILGARLLAVPRCAPLNVHASILPRHRGAAPANWAIRVGDSEAGVSIMRMERGLDTGPVYHVARTPINPRETAGELLGRLGLLGAEALSVVLAGYSAIVPVPQDETRATWARRLCKEDGAVDWRGSAIAIDRQVRALHPWPSAVTHVAREPLKLHAVEVIEPIGTMGQSGEIVAIYKHGIDVACGEGMLRLLEVQASGRRRMPVADYLRGARLDVGAVFQSPDGK